MDFLTRADRTKVPPELMAEALEMLANLPTEDRGDDEVRMIRFFELLDRKDLQDQRRDIAMSIDFRLTAMGRLIAAKEAYGWTQPGTEDGMELIHPSLVYAAAEDPLIEDSDHQASFGPDSFRRRVLAITKIEGKG